MGYFDDGIFSISMTAVSATTGTFSGNVTVGGTLDSAGDFSVATNKFNVTAASGNTSIAGTANVVGDFSVATNKFNVTASNGNVAVAGTANVVGNFSVATNKFNVTASNGNTAIAGTANVVGDFSVATSKFTVAAASGNTAVAGTLGVTGMASLVGVKYPTRLQPAVISGNTNNYAPGMAGKSILQVSASSAFDITGLDVTGLDDGQAILLMNIGGLNAITLKYNSGSSSVGNKFLCPGAVDYVLGGYESVWLYIDKVQQFVFVLGTA